MTNYLEAKTMTSSKAASVRTSHMEGRGNDALVVRSLDGIYRGGRGFDTLLSAIETLDLRKIDHSDIEAIDLSPPSMPHWLP